MSSNIGPARRFPFLDVLRASAILLVIGCHFRHLPGAPEWFKWIFMRGTVGVDIFFVLSGWLIGGQMLRHVRRTDQVPWFGFWMRRWLRTLPAYFAALGLVVVLGFTRPSSYLEFTFFLQNYTAPFEWLVTWSLCIEEHFYLALPFLMLACLFLRRLSRPGMIVTVLFALTLPLLIRWVEFEELALSQDFAWFLAKHYSPTHLRFEGLLMGVALAAMAEWRTPMWCAMQRHAGAVGALGFLLVVGTTWNPWVTGWTSAPEDRMMFFPAVFHFSVL